MAPTFKPLKAGLFEREKVEPGRNGIWGGRGSAYLCWDFGAVACHLGGKMWPSALLPQSSTGGMNVGEHSKPERDTFKHHNHYLGAARRPPTSFKPHLAKCFEIADLSGLLCPIHHVSLSFLLLCVLSGQRSPWASPLPTACWLLTQIDYFIHGLATPDPLTHQLKRAFPSILLRSTWSS